MLIRDENSAQEGGRDQNEKPPADTCIIYPGKERGKARLFLKIKSPGRIAAGGFILEGRKLGIGVSWLFDYFLFSIE